MASTVTPDAFLLLDDASRTSELAVVNSSGRLLGRIPVTGMSARNGEALASGRCGTRTCVYIGDVGDNNARRADIVVYRIVEPGLSAVNRPIPAQVWRYTYPDGPYDAEALVAAPDGSLLLITKPARRGFGTVAPHRLYRAPAGGGTLRLLTTFVPPAPAHPLQSLLTGTVITDAAYRNGRMLLLTYDQVIEYRAPSAATDDDESGKAADPAAFLRWPHRELPNPQLVQQEGIALPDNGCGYVAVSERGPDGSRSSLETVTCRE